MIWLFLPVFLFATLFVPRSEIKIENAKIYSNINQVDFNNSVAVVSYKMLPFVLENNLTIITPVKNLKLYLVSKKPLKDVKRVEDDLILRIFFKAFKKNVEFSKYNVDAFLSPSLKKGYYNYDLSKFGINFNKYFLVGKRSYINANKTDVEFISALLNEKYPTNRFYSLNSVLLTALYLNKKANLNFFFDIKEEIEKRDFLKVVVTPNWPPFDIYENNELKGIGIDFWRLIAKKAGLDYEIIIEPVWLKVLESIKNKSADITPNTSQTKDREKYAIFSKPYVKFPLAIVCRNDANIDSIKEIKSLAVGYNFTAHKLMKKHYPNLKYIGAENTFEALKFVEDKKAQCAVDILPTIIWYINNYHLVGFKIVKTTDFTFNLQVMIRKDLKEVKRKIDLAIDKITPEEKDAIINKYIGIKLYNQKPGSLKFFIIISFIFLIMVVLFKKVLKYKAQAQIDALTKIYNRGTIERKFKELKEDGSVIFFDIDFFKKINDTYGHEFGDFVLENLAMLIKNNIRSSDIFGRWGGEEFLIILPNTKYEDALKIAEKLRLIIKNHKFKDVKITSSFGVSEFKRNEDVDEVMARVDKALYKAKNSGRDRVKGVL